jgi:hypothetical protein
MLSMESEVVTFSNIFCTVSKQYRFFLLGLDQMLEENRVEDLTLFYQLLSRVHNGLKELNSSFASYIKVSM